MKKSKKVKSFISLLVTFAILFVSMPIMSINVVAAACRCSNPSPTSRTISPTCTSQGYRETYCTRCGGTLSKTNYTGPIAHSMQTTINATCSSAGTRKCSRCSYTQSIPATGNHSPATRTKTAATCTGTGTNETYCTSCGKVLSTSTIAALGHSMQTAINATCGNAGTRKCSRCSYAESISATGNHNPATRTKTAATCTADGVKETYCTVCNNVLSTGKLDKLGHSLETIQNATCGSSGTKKCKRTGCTYTESIPATGNHNPDARVKTPATCTTEGVKETYCKLCDTVLNTSPIPKTDHQLETIKFSNCGTEGLKKCKNCSHTETVSATGNHNPDARIKTPATCTVEGVKETYCKLCDTVLNTSPIPKTDHQLETIKGSTCGTEGTKKCKNCGYTESIPATGNHSPAIRTKTAATCTATGTEETYCTLCNKVLSTSSIPSLGHNMQLNKAATCGTNGNKKCTRPGCFRFDTIAATGEHNRPSGAERRVIKKPTCTTSGTEEMYCLDCSATLATYTIPALSHKIIYTPINSNLHRVACGHDGCAMNAGNITDSHTFVNNICSNCKYDRAVNCEHINIYSKKILPTCMNGLIIETRCEDCEKLLNSRSIPTGKGDHLLEWVSVQAHPCGAQISKGTCKTPGCKYTTINSNIDYSTCMNPNPGYRVTKAPTCKTTGTFEYFCKDCNKTLGEGTLPTQHTGLQISYKYGLEYGIGSAYHLVLCGDCNEYYVEPHQMEIYPDDPIYDCVRCNKCGCDLVYAETVDDLIMQPSYSLGGSNWIDLLDALLSTQYNSGIPFDEDLLKTVLEAYIKDPIDEEMDKLIEDIKERMK